MPGLLLGGILRAGLGFGGDVVALHVTKDCGSEAARLPGQKAPES